MAIKQIKDVKSEISDIKHRVEEEEITEAEEKRLRKKIPFLRKCILYLETEPKEEFCKSEVERICKMINTRVEMYKEPRNADKLTKKELSKRRRDHEKEWEVPKLRMQLKTLNYLLK